MKRLTFKHIGCGIYMSQATDVNDYGAFTVIRSPLKRGERPWSLKFKTSYMGLVSSGERVETFSKLNEAKDRARRLAAGEPV